jgi:hypothetical protein
MVSQQLSLFDAATVAKPTYKIGDLVKVKRKTPHAPLLKKGDIVQIETIHPHNGSCKFWNEFTESWGYLYPDEFVLIPPAPAGNDSVTSSAEVGVTESIPEPADSVTSSAEVGVTESIPEPADSVTSSVSTYKPRGTDRSIENCPLEYFRFSYREGSKVRHVHIRGGNTASPIAQAKVAEVRSLLAAGVSPAEVATMLRIVISNKCETNAR